MEECDEDALTDREECNEEKDLGQRVDCMIEDVVQVILCKAEYAITVYQNSFCQKCRNWVEVGSKESKIVFFQNVPILKS